MKKKIISGSLKISKRTIADLNEESKNVFGASNIGPCQTLGDCTNYPQCCSCSQGTGTCTCRDGGLTCTCPTSDKCY